jgi:hypothetical protein
MADRSRLLDHGGERIDDLAAQRVVCTLHDYLND